MGETGAVGIGLLLLRTMHDSLRRALPLDSVNGCTHNPTRDRHPKLPAVAKDLMRIGAKRLSLPSDMEGHFTDPLVLFASAIRASNKPGPLRPQIT